MFRTSVCLGQVGVCAINIDFILGDKSFDDKQTPESDLHVSKKKKLAVIKSSGGLTSGFISGSGRLVPVLGKESPKTVALADLAKQPVHTDEKEMRELDGRVGTSLVPSSTESSLSSSELKICVWFRIKNFIWHTRKSVAQKYGTRHGCHVI